MRFFKTFILLTLLYSGLGAQIAKAEDQITANVFTDVGGGKYTRQVGFLFESRGFVPTSGGIPADYDANVSAATVAALAGRPVLELSNYLIFKNTGGVLYDAFDRSTETYSLNGVPFVILSVGGSAGGGSFVKTPKISISAIVPTCTETLGTPCQFLITLSAPSRKTIRARFTVDGKATRGKDYLRFPNSVAIPSGNVSAIVEVIPVDDAQREGTENVRIKLLPQNAYRLKRASATVQITDND